MGLSFNDRTITVSERLESLIGRNGRLDLVVIPWLLRLGGAFHLGEIHVVNRSAVGPDLQMREQRIVDLAALHFLDYLRSVVGLLSGNRLPIRSDPGIDT